MSMTEKVAFALWHDEAFRGGAPESVYRMRTPEAFANQSDDTRQKWLRIASVAIGAMTDPSDDALERMAKAYTASVVQGFFESGGIAQCEEMTGRKTAMRAALSTLAGEV